MKNLNKISIKRICYIILLTLFFIHNTLGFSEAFTGSLVADYLFELGRRLYDQGYYQDARDRFKKILLINPEHKEAFHYIKLIEKTSPPPPLVTLPPALPPILSLEDKIISELRFKLKESQAQIDRLTQKLEQERLTGEEASNRIQELMADLAHQKELRLDLETRLNQLLREKKISKPLPLPEEEKYIIEERYYPEDKEIVMEEALDKMERLSKAPVITIEKITPPFIPSVMLPEIEEPSAIKIYPPTAIERKGEIGLFIDGKEVFTEKPILIKEGRVLVGLKDIASNLYFSLLYLKDGNFRLISPQGESKDIKVSLIEGEPMITEEKLRDYFLVETYFDESQKAFYIRTKSPSQLQIYALEKSQEEIKKEKALQEIIKRATLVSEKPTFIPEAARPSVQLRGTVSRTYIDYHISPTYHSMSSSLTGKAYDFDLKYESSWKDINGVFDHDYTYLNLSKPDLFIGLFDQSIDLYPLRMQSESFTGLKIIKGWENINKTTLVGGKTENSASGTSGSVKYLGKIYGIEEEFFPLEWLSLKGALLYLENEADIPSLSGTSSFPRNNLVSFYEAFLKLPYNLTLSSQLARCYYRPDNDPNVSVEDWDWRIGSELNKQRYRLGLNYELVGDRYASFGNPQSYQDYSGWNFYGNYRVTDNWSLGTNAMYYHNNVDGDLDKITTESTTFSLSSYHRLTDEQSFNLNFSRFISDPSGPDCGSSNKSNLYRIDYFLPFLFDIRSILNYQYYRTDSPGASQYYSHNSGASLFKSFGRGSSWYLSQQFTKTLYKSAADSLNSNTSFNLNYKVNPELSLYLNSSYTRNKIEQSTASDTFSGSTGVKCRIFPDTNLNLEYNVNSYSLDTEKGRWPRNWSIMAYISQSFGLSSPPNFGVIKGWVFKDINANGRIESGEPGVEGVTLYLEDKKEIVTNSKGYFSFPYVVPGEQKIYLDLANFSDSWAARDFQKEVEVRPRRDTVVTFPLVEACLITGKVFVDENLDSVFQEIEEPLDGISIILMPGEQFRRTDNEGDFKFAYLLPGRYKISINLEDIPLGYELVSGEEIELEVLAGEEIKDINFVVRLMPVHIKKF